MSCSVHDSVRLERLGVPSVVVGTEPFLDEALEQARLLGMPEQRTVLVPHPVQLLTPEQMCDLAERAFPQIQRRLLATDS